MNRSPRYCIVCGKGGIPIFSYDVYYRNRVFGRLYMEVNGLYYKISFQFKSVDKVLRLIDRCDNGDISVGICAQTQKGFGIEKKIPVKRLGIGAHHFELVPAECNADAYFIELFEEKNCEAVTQLENARFCLRNGKPGLMITVPVR